jgi:hypothetical protein
VHRGNPWAALRLGALPGRACVTMLTPSRAGAQAAALVARSSAVPRDRSMAPPLSLQTAPSDLKQASCTARRILLWRATKTLLPLELLAILGGACAQQKSTHASVSYWVDLQLSPGSARCSGCFAGWVRASARCDVGAGHAGGSARPARKVRRETRGGGGTLAVHRLRPVCVRALCFVR